MASNVLERDKVTSRVPGNVEQGSQGCTRFGEPEALHCFFFNGKLHQSGECCSERWRTDWLEGQRQGQDELHTQDCNRACQHEIQTWSHARRPCVCCKSLAIIARLLRPDLPDVRGHNVTMVWICVRQDVLNEIISVLIACNLS